jgi:hypothetical protein
MSRLYPRINRATAAEVITRLAGGEPAEITSDMPVTDVEHHHGPVGGGRVEPGELAWLRELVVGIASELGFPAGDRRTQRIEFDRLAAPALTEALDMTSHEAAQEGVWSYITCCLLLDVAIWRFPDPPKERLLGRPRNAFRRLWWRGHILGTAEGGPLARLGEDEIVQIMERPTLGGDPAIARALAGAFLQAVEGSPDLPRMELMRDTARRLIRITPFTMLGAMGTAVRSLLDEIVNDAVAGLRGEAPEPPAPDQLPLPTLSPAASGAEQVLDLARGEGGVTNTRIRELLGTDAAGARALLSELVEAGHLEQRGSRRGTHYVARD